MVEWIDLVNVFVVFQEGTNNNYQMICFNENSLNDSLLQETRNLKDAAVLLCEEF